MFLSVVIPASFFSHPPIFALVSTFGWRKTKKKRKNAKHDENPTETLVMQAVTTHLTL